MRAPISTAMILALGAMSVGACGESSFSGNGERAPRAKAADVQTEPEEKSDREPEKDEEQLVMDSDVETTSEPVQPVKKVPKTPVDLIKNGSFETHVTGGFAEFFAGDSTSLAFWTITKGSIHLCPVLCFAAHDGNFSVDLDGNTGSTGGMSQTVTTEKGARYRLMFALAGNYAGAPTIKTFRIEANTQTHDETFDISGKTATDMGYVEKEWEFVADSDKTEVRFVSTTTGNPGWGAVIDRVRMFEVVE